MEERTLELLRALQTAERTEPGLAGVQAMLDAERPGLRTRGDRATLADASELLEVWAEAAPSPVAAGGLRLAADIAERDLEQVERAEQLHAHALELAPTQLASLDALERILLTAGRREEFEPLLAAHADRLAAAEGHDPELLASLLRKLGGLRDAASDLAGAISAYERALEHSADPELVRALADAYARRNAPGDGTQAAELYTMLADVLGPPEASAMVERALDLAPGHLSALEMLENATPEAERATRVMERWERFVGSSDDDAAVDARRPALARAYVAAGRHKDALACIGPLVDRGDTAAAELQAECLAALREQEQEHETPAAPTAEGAKAEAPREPTLVGFRLPRSSSAPQADAAEAELDGDDVPAKPDSGVHKRAVRTGGTLVGFRLSEETIAALKAQDAAEASLRARAQARADVDAVTELADAARAAKPATDGAAVAATPAPEAKDPASKEPAKKGSAKKDSGRPGSGALSPAEHAARLRRSVPAPAAVAADSAPIAAGANPRPAARTSTPAPSPSRPSAPAPRHVTPTASRPRDARAVGPAQLAESLRGRASTPPPARTSSEIAAASAAAQHAASLRRSSPGSVAAPASRVSATTSSAPASLAAASAHAAVLRRSSPGMLAGAASAAAATAPSVTPITAPGESVVQARSTLSGIEEAVANEPEELAAAYERELDAAAQPQHAYAADQAGTEDPPAAHADGGRELDAAGYVEEVGPAAVSPSVPPGSPFAVAPSPVPNLAAEPFATAPERSGGSSRKRLAMAVAAVAGLGVVAAWMFGGGSKPAAPAAEAPSAAATPTPAPVPTVAAPSTAVAAVPVAPTTSPTGGLAQGAAGAAAAAAVGGTAAATATPTEPASADKPGKKTQDERSLGRVELAGPAKVRNGGKLRPKDVADAVRAQLPALERCYTETLEDKPSAEGGLTFAFTIAKTGKATAVKKTAGTLKDAALARCAADALGDARFDKPKRPAKVTLPLRFAKR
jgi:tetratricopeptide (TPR) repeat protein